MFDDLLRLCGIQVDTIETAQSVTLRAAESYEDELAFLAAKHGLLVMRKRAELSAELVRAEIEHQDGDGGRGD